MTLSNIATASSDGIVLTAVDTAAATVAAVSLPTAVAEPQPAIPPPSPIDDPRSVESRPRVVNVNGGDFIFDEETRVCKAPTNWGVDLDGNPNTPSVPFSGPWEYQWLRNGAPILGATSSEYVPDIEDKYSVLQCEIVGVSGTGVFPGGGSTVSISGNSVWVVSTGSTSSFTEGFGALENVPGNNIVANLPGAEFSNTATGLVTLNIELPGGTETYAFRAQGNGWDCDKFPPNGATHAHATCTRSDPRPPQSAYPTIELVERPGRDAPDLLVTKATISGGGSEPGSDEDTIGPLLPAGIFGFEAFETKVLDDLGNDYTRAGGHPFSAGATLKLNTHVKSEAVNSGFGIDPFTAANGSVRVVKTDTPRGFVGNAQAAPKRCLTLADVKALPSTCPPGSVVGGIDLETSEGGFFNLPIFAMEPEFGTPAQFAFGVSNFNLGFSLTPELRAEDGYAISLLSAPAPKAPELFGAKVVLCGFGAKLGVSPTTNESEMQGCRKAGEAGSNPIPLITNPTRCAGQPPTTVIAADSWEEPGVFRSKSFTAPALTNCDEVPFEPEISLQPTSTQADSPTGLDVDIAMPTAGLEEATGIAQANLANSTVTMPVGMSVNPSLAGGLGACSPAQIGLGTNNPVSCPESAKVGSVEVQTPLLAETLKGSVYVAQQKDNPFGSLLALYLVLESKRDGILIKIAGKVTPDPVTGQLTASFRENPEAPFSHLALHFAGGERAPLITPPVCGNYEIRSDLSPWSAQDPGNPTAAETVTQTSVFTVNSGPGGSACPSEALEPKLTAGVVNSTAGATTPFVLDLSRNDGTQRFASLNVTMPPGLSGYLGGIERCSDATLASIPGAEGTGAAQLASPSCPAASRLGSVSVGAGAGPSPFYANTGTAYLAGPYKGAPLSIAIVTPAVAGPFDLGNVVVRNAAYVDPTTAQITVKSDPIPTILHGLLLDVRDIRVNIDRPNFILAPTNCEPMSVSAQVGGEKGASATVSNPFQVGGCEKLKFKPNVKIRLHGKTRRAAYQRLEATVTAKPGEANIARAAVTFPHSAFLAQEHINTICTRVQFAAQQCPAGSVYGHATAITPLLDEPLSGPVYLRSSSNPLPDVVVALRGPASLPIEVALAGRVDSKNGGIRNTFELVPDAPVSKFTLKMKGGKKSLIVNSRNLCKGTQRATVRLTGQNGMTNNFRPVVANDCKKKGKKGGGKGSKGGK